MSSKAAPESENVPASWPRRVWLPGALREAIEARIKELGLGTLSRYLVELIAYDLRRRRAHTLTRIIGLKSLEVQQAIDLAIACHYRPGFKSPKEQLFRVAAMGFADSLTGLRAEPLMTRTRQLVYLRGRHRGIMRERMQQLGFAHLSEYVISLIRFDLLVGGPHNSHRGDESPKECAALDQKTIKTYENEPPKKCMIDYVVEEIAGRELSPEERDAALEKVAELLADEAVAAQKKARKAG